MPDNIMPVTGSTNSPAKSSLEEDFPTLTPSATPVGKVPDDTSSVAPAWYKPPEASSTPTQTPVPQTIPTSTTVSSVTQPTTTTPVTTPAAPPTPTASVAPPSVSTSTPTPPTTPITNNPTITDSTPSGFLQTPNPSTSVFTPLGGSDTPPAEIVTVPHMEFTTNPPAAGGFQGLVKEIVSVKPPKDDLTTTNIYPDAVPITEKPKSPLAIILPVSIAFFVIAVIFGGIYSVAYGYLNINNPQITDTVSNFVQKLPLTPKTAKFLIMQTTQAQKTITKENFELSLSARSKELESVFNTTNAEAAIKGSIDYSNLKNVKFSVNTSVTKDLNVDIRSADSKIYFHLNKLPPALISMTGFSESDIQTLTKDWIYYDATPLEAEANKALDSNNSSPNSYKESVQKIQNIVFDDRVLDRITVTDDAIGKTPVHKLLFVATDETIDYIGKELAYQFGNQATLSQDEKYSDYIKDLTMELWVQQGNYHMRKLVLSFRSLNDSPDPKLGTQKSSSDINITYSLSDIGKDFTVEIPQNSISVNDFFQRLQQKYIERNPQYMSSSSAPTSVNFSNLLPR